MAFVVQLVATAAERDMALRLRHRVYVEEERRFPARSDGSFGDGYDELESTRTLLAYSLQEGGAEPIGTVRYSLSANTTIPADAFMPRARSARPDAALCWVGMLAIPRAHRFTPGLLVALLRAALGNLRALGGQHLIAPCAPDILEVVKGVGAHVGDVIYAGETRVPMIPIHLDLGAPNRPIDELTFGADTHEEISPILVLRRGDRAPAAGTQPLLYGERWRVRRGALWLGGAARSARLLGPGDVLSTDDGPCGEVASQTVELARLSELERGASAAPGDTLSAIASELRAAYITRHGESPRLEWIARELGASRVQLIESLRECDAAVVSDEGAELEQTTGFVRLARVSELEGRTAARFTVGRTAVALFRSGGEWLAVEDRCPHAGAPLSAGRLDGGNVVCPLHRWRFDLRTGQRQPALRNGVACLSRYELRVDGDWISIRRPSSASMLANTEWIGEGATHEDPARRAV